MPSDSVCGRCSVKVHPDDAERCFICEGPLCYGCWQGWGHCGHAEAVEADDRPVFTADEAEARGRAEVAAFRLGQESAWKNPRRAVRLEKLQTIAVYRVHYDDGTWDDFGSDGLPLKGD
jgi:hypothetical protein